MSSEANVTPIKSQKYAFNVIITGFAIIGGLATMSVLAQIFAPGNVTEFTLLGGAMGYIGGFLAGRKA